MRLLSDEMRMRGLLQVKGKSRLLFAVPSIYICVCVYMPRSCFDSTNSTSSVQTLYSESRSTFCVFHCHTPYNSLFFDSNLGRSLL